MWELWMIIAVAAGGAVSLTVSAALTVVYFERKRHRRLMARRELDRNTSQIQRHHLSINDVDVSVLPRPAKALHAGYQRARSDSARFYSIIPSQDDLSTFPDASLADPLVHRPHAETADNSHQWLAPTKSGRFKRKKKLAKVSASHSMPRSPMSAITEATESSRTGTPDLVELPAHITPERMPHKSGIPMSVRTVQTSQISIDSILGMPESVNDQQPISHGNMIKSRSISMGDIAPPPDIPLPPIPTTASYAQQRQASLSRSKSDISLHARDQPASHQQFPLKQYNSGLSGFVFELTGDNLPNTNDATNKSKSKPAPLPFRFPSLSRTTDDGDDGYKTIDASGWNLPTPLRATRPITPVTPTFPINSSDAGSRSVSMVDYDAIFSASSSLNNSPTKVHEGTPSRPVSAASITSTDMFRLSVIGGKVPESPRGINHKRGNCVRIKNLTPIDTKKRLSSHLGRLTEAEEDDGSILLPSPSRIGQIQTAPASAASSPILPELDSSLIEPSMRPNQHLSLRVKRPGTSLKDKYQRIRPLPTPGDPIKQKQTQPLHTFANNQANRRVMTERGPTILEAIKTSGLEVSSSPVSSTRLFSPDSPQRKRTQIQGPRNAPPPSLRIRNQNRIDSPLRRKSSESERVSKQHLHHQRGRKTSDADLQKSIAMLKNMTLPETVSTWSVENLLKTPVARTPSSRYADSPTIKVPKVRMRSNTVAGHTGERTQTISSRLTSPSHAQTQQRRDITTIQPTPHWTTSKIPTSRSNISIWEDDSINGDIPETLDLPDPSLTKSKASSSPTTHSYTTPSTTTKPQRHPSQYSPVKSHRAHFDQLSLTNYSRSISSQQYHQLGQTPPSTSIPQESLWNDHAFGSRGEKSPVLVSPRGRFHSSAQTGVMSPTQGTMPGRGEKMRGATVSMSMSGSESGCMSGVVRSGQTQMGMQQGVGLGLKFGERSMAYTVNEMDGGGRLR